MEVVLAKNAGFCFGVKRAIVETEKILEKSKSKIFSIGSIIHNESVINNLKNKGLVELNDIKDIINRKKCI